jgi:hypothetical protein
MIRICKRTTVILCKYSNLGLSHTHYHVSTNFRMFTIHKLNTLAGEAAQHWCFKVIYNVLPDDDSFRVETYMRKLKKI